VADRLPGTKKDLQSSLREHVRRVNATSRPTSTLVIGEWVLEARPTGLHITHGPTGTTSLLAAQPINTEEVQA